MIFLTNLKINKEYKVIGFGFIANTTSSIIKVKDQRNNRYIITRLNKDSNRFGRKLYYLDLGKNDIIIDRNKCLIVADLLP